MWTAKEKGVTFFFFSLLGRQKIHLCTFLAWWPNYKKKKKEERRSLVCGQSLNVRLHLQAKIIIIVTKNWEWYACVTRKKSEAGKVSPCKWVHSAALPTVRWVDCNHSFILIFCGAENRTKNLDQLKIESPHHYLNGMTWEGKAQRKREVGKME